MHKPNKKAWAALTVLGMFANSANAADEPGVVRISDKAVSRANYSTTSNLTQNAAPGAESVPCDANGCYAGDGAGGCYGGGDYFTRSGDSGFRRVVCEPVLRDAIVYHRWWPNRFYGQPGWSFQGGYPMVYMPTDTTQLGFYAQRVPQWLPNPNMVPPAPWPTQWHRREAFGGCGGSANAGVIQGGVVQQTTPSPAVASPEQTSPSTPPAPLPAADSASNIPTHSKLATILAAPPVSVTAIPAIETPESVTVEKAKLETDVQQAAGAASGGAADQGSAKQ